MVPKGVAVDYDQEKEGGVEVVGMRRGGKRARKEGDKGDRVLGVRWVGWWGDWWDMGFMIVC